MCETTLFHIFRICHFIVEKMQKNLVAISYMYFKSTHEDTVVFLFRGSVLSYDVLCLYVQRRKYSGGHQSFVIFFNAGAGWLFKSQVKRHTGHMTIKIWPK